MLWLTERTLLDVHLHLHLHERAWAPRSGRLGLVLDHLANDPALDAQRPKDEHAGRAAELANSYRAAFTSGPFPLPFATRSFRGGSPSTTRLLYSDERGYHLPPLVPGEGASPVSSAPSDAGPPR